MNNNAMQMLMQMMRGGQNPQQMLQGLMQKNPQFNAVLNQQRQSGMSMEQYVRNYAKQNNIDLNPMLEAMRKQGFKI